MKEKTLMRERGRENREGSYVWEVVREGGGGRREDEGKKH